MTEWTKTTPTEPGWYWQSDGKTIRTYFLMDIEIENKLWDRYSNIRWQRLLPVPEPLQEDL